jgi:RimJ/RimL family protein N-acetyltransferase
MDVRFPMIVRPVTLEGTVVRLDPLRGDHVDELTEVGLFPELWSLQPRIVRTVDDMRAYVGLALTEALNGTALPFVIVDRASGRLIGSTRYMDIQPEHRRLEIGATWLTPAHQRTKANTEAKLLLLTHAFETLGAQRVVLKTDMLNTQSQRAMERIGAVREGIFRKHLIAETGRVRDMVYYAILDDEWPGVKQRLTSKLAQ